MATSRTGTGKWRRLRAHVIRTARAAGQTHCPRCRRELDYDGPRGPRKAEVHHLVDHHLGGTDDVANLAVLCAECNQALSSRAKSPKAAVRADLRAPALFPLSGAW